MNNARAIMSWSGGKDSCLALHRAISQGCRVKYLLNFVSDETSRMLFHDLENRLIQLQAESIGIPLYQRAVPSTMAGYKETFKAAVASIGDVREMVFGDIYLEEHKEWIERVCDELGIRAVEPLWGEAPVDLMREFVRAGFKAIIVSCRADIFDPDFVGRMMDEVLIDELGERGICPCGENGEFHTFVIDGPLFKRRIRVDEASPVLRHGVWSYWFLDIKKTSII
ncbi:MAG: diphthine--ammonia ligase [Actinomycetota bacterium]